MWYIGDVHNHYNRYNNFCKNLPESLQLGDMGVGFPVKDYELSRYKYSPAPYYHKNHKFICGNHDNYQYASKFPNCLKRFGYIKEKGIFYISGGYSVDKQCRTPNETWWEWEELNDKEQEECFKLYKEINPEIVASHDCPTVAKYWALHYSNGGVFNSNISTNTEMFLNKLWVEKEPKYWIHGHYHQFYTKQEGNTMFIGLDELLNGKKDHCIFEINT